VPLSAWGPPRRRRARGGGGTTGIITRAWLRVRPAPEVVRDRGWVVPDLTAGLTALRAIVRTGAMPAILRLYDEADTALVFGGQGLPVPDGCLLIVGCEGRHDVATFVEQVASEELRRLGAHDLGSEPGTHWRAHRHDVSYRFAEYMKPGGTFGDALTIDTMEVAARWRDLPELYRNVREALQEHVDLVLAHVSHVYDTGASIYFTLGAMNAGDEARALARYDAAWEAGQQAALELGATASHHHGIGLLRAPVLPTELGTVGWQVLQRLKYALDPQGLLNPGKLGLGVPPDGGPA
jgi:alkyldihydroxyacetonephosphate synthase